MTYLTLSFDTEDYVNPAAADGILRCAEILRRNGVVGCFNVVARLAQALVKWSRQDVIDALKYHEIETHSLAHSFHPTIDEYTDLANFDEAKARLLKNETEALRILSEILGVKKVYAACPPGNSTSYVAHYAYAELGIPFYDGDNLYDAKRGRPVNFCNINSLQYSEGLFETTTETDNLLSKDREEILHYLDRVAAEKDYIVLYHHPQKGIIPDFCDILNFNGFNRPENEWILSPLRPNEEIERFYQNFEWFVQTLKSDPRFQIITYRELGDIYPATERRILPEMLSILKAQLSEEWFPVTAPDSFSISDILFACRDFLLGKSEHYCGTVYGFLTTPYAISEPVTLTAQELKESATQITDGFLPEFVWVGDKKLGLADWLRAALEILTGADSVTVAPGAWQIDLNEFPEARDLNYRNSWIHSPQLEDRFLSERLRLQSWTIRLPKGTARKIY